MIQPTNGVGSTASIALRSIHSRAPARATTSSRNVLAMVKLNATSRSSGGTRASRCRLTKGGQVAKCSSTTASASFSLLV